ncbi:MAG: hypothetical protein ACK5QT_10045 [Oligoflexia bacterium]|jgi:hypothetical protein
MATFSDVASQGWATYGSVFVAMLGALGLPVMLHLLGRAVGVWPKKNGAAEEAPPQKVDISPESTLNTRYFSAAQVGAILAIPLFVLLPLVGVRDGWASFATLAIVSVCVCIGAALVYANRKRDLRWIDSVLPPSKGGDS